MWVGVGTCGWVGACACVHVCVGYYIHVPLLVIIRGVVFTRAVVVPVSMTATMQTQTATAMTTAEVGRQRGAFGISLHDEYSPTKW